MSEYGFEIFCKKRDIDNKVCIYFKGINPSISMQYVIGNKFTVYRLCDKYDYVHTYEIKRR